MVHNVSMDYYTALFLASGILVLMPRVYERDGNVEVCVGVCVCKCVCVSASL